MRSEPGSRSSTLHKWAVPIRSGSSAYLDWISPNSRPVKTLAVGKGEQQLGCRGWIDRCPLRVKHDLTRTRTALSPTWGRDLSQEA